MLVCAFIFIPETLPRARRQERGSTTVRQRYASVLSDRVFIGVLIIGGMTFSGLFSYLSASSFLFQQTYGFDAQQYGLLFAVNSLGVVVGVQSASRLAARFGPQWVHGVLDRGAASSRRSRSSSPTSSASASGARSSRCSSS